MSIMATIYEFMTQVLGVPVQLSKVERAGRRRADMTRTFIV